MNIKEAKDALHMLSLDTVHMPETVGPRNVLRLFIKSVEAKAIPTLNAEEIKIVESILDLLGPMSLAQLQGVLMQLKVSKAMGDD